MTLLKKVYLAPSLTRIPFRSSLFVFHQLFVSRCIYSNSEAIRILDISPPPPPPPLVQQHYGVLNGIARATTSSRLVKC